MIEGSIKRDLILNGSNSIATFKESGATYRVEPVGVVQEISLFDFERNTTKIFKLDDRLTKDYEILGIVADIPNDDGDADEASRDAGSQPTVTVGIRVFQGKKAVNNVQLRFNSYPYYTNKLFINHRDTWHMKVDRDVTSITFMCKPIYLENPIVFP